MHSRFALGRTRPLARAAGALVRGRDRYGLGDDDNGDLSRRPCARCLLFLVNQGVDLYTVGNILGHSSPAVTKKHAHQATQARRVALGKLGDSIRKLHQAKKSKTKNAM
jgi:hypothetical protein